MHLLDVKNKLNIIMQSMCCKKLSYKPMLRTYAHMKDTIKTMPFLKGNICKFQCSLLTQLRIGSLALAVVTGRYHHIPLENLRQICKKKFVEDEIHFVCKRSAYNWVRQIFFSNLRYILMLMKWMHMINFIIL